MERKYTTDEYFRLPETNRRAELLFGSVREPPSPAYGHQRTLGRLYRLMSAHVEERRLGEVCLSPLDVVLDKDAGLVVQPDLLFIAAGRTSIIRDQVWGAPDLVVEIASPWSEYRDRTLKLAWYRRYGVRECWFVYPNERRIAVVDCESGGEQSFEGAGAIASRVLPGLTVSADACFDL